MVLDELHIAINHLESSSSPSYSQIKRFFTASRETRSHIPEYTYKYGTFTLQKFSSKLTLDEIWQLREDVAVAAMELGRYNEAYKLIDAIRRQFPDTTRSSRLLGMHCESTGNFQEAEALYTAELQNNPRNQAILKRLVGLRKNQNNIPGAIEALKSYLDVNMADGLAWMELGELYIQLGLYSQAIFSLEEALLHQPGNISLLLLLAETLYTAGGSTHVEAARSYFAGVVEATSGENVRALYGVCRCQSYLKSGNGSELAKVAVETLLQRYAIQCPEKLRLVKSTLE